MTDFTKEQIDAVEIDEDSYEYKERLAILQENNPKMNIVHARNKAKKEIRIRILEDLENIAKILESASPEQSSRE